MAISPARKRANQKYNAKAYDNIMIRVGKGDKEKISKFAAEHGESLNGFIKRAIKEAMEKGEE